MDVNIDFGVASQGEKQVAHLYVVDHNAVGFGFGRRAWLGQCQRLLHGRGYVAEGYRLNSFAADMPLQRFTWRRR